MSSVHTQHMPHIMIVNRLEPNKERFRPVRSNTTDQRRLRSNLTAFLSIPAIRSKDSTSVLSTRKFRPIFFSCLQADHTLGHKGLWFQVNHRLNHIWPRLWSDWNHKLCFFMEHGVSKSGPYMSRV